MHIYIYLIPEEINLYIDRIEYSFINRYTHIYEVMQY